MDLKGITWAADTYEKFEAMCLEVEEAIYEVKSPFSSFVICFGSSRSFFKDTIKYLENQVQKAGVSVKTFCAEVVQDLLSPSSCVSPLKVAAAVDSSLEPYGQTDINKKPKPTISDNHGELNKKQAGVGHICDLTAEDSTLSDDAKHLPPMPFRDLDGNILSEECSRKSIITHKREVESVGEEAIASYEDSFDIEVIEPVENWTLEESCMLVEGNELHSVSQGSKKQKSYKKKIYDVLSLKLRSMRKQDDLCISDHKDLSDKNGAAAGAMSPALAMDCHKRKLHDHSSCDFGWELV